ncbi:MAG: hypothetical protein ACFHHU_00670 [Porticoccaceae bacterium]
MTSNIAPAFDVILEEGLVQAVQFHDPALKGLIYRVIDLDTEGACDDQLASVPKTDGTTVSVWCREAVTEEPEHALCQPSQVTLDALAAHNTPENKGHDVDVIPVYELDEDHAPEFNKPWLVQFADAEYIEVDTEEEACALQRAWREMTGCEHGS